MLEYDQAGVFIICFAEESAFPSLVLVRLWLLLLGPLHRVGLSFLSEFQLAVNDVLLGCYVVSNQHSP